MIDLTELLEANLNDLAVVFALELNGRFCLLDDFQLDARFATTGRRSKPEFRGLHGSTAKTHQETEVNYLRNGQLPLVQNRNLSAVRHFVISSDQEWQG